MTLQLYENREEKARKTLQFIAFVSIFSLLQSKYSDLLLLTCCPDIVTDSIPCLCCSIYKFLIIAIQLLPHYSHFLSLPIRGKNTNILYVVRFMWQNSSIDQIDQSWPPNKFYLSVAADKVLASSISLACCHFLSGCSLYIMLPKVPPCDFSDGPRTFPSCRERKP